MPDDRPTESTSPETLDIPESPTKLWMLWAPEAQSWVRSIDDARGGCTFLVATSEATAVRAAEHQDDVYDVFCVPIRVK